YVDGDGVEQSMQLPLTTADWAATEGRFKKHFKPLKGDASDDQVPFHEFVHLAPEEREGKTPFIYATTGDRRLKRLSVAMEIVGLAEERQQFWLELRHLAGLEVPESVRDRVTSQMEGEFESRIQAIRQEYEGKIQQLKAQYPMQVARRLAEGLLKSPGGQRLAQELMGTGALGASLGELIPAEKPAEQPGNGQPATTVLAAPTPAAPAPAAAAPIAAVPTTAPTATPAPADSDDLAMEAYIESVRCTTCNECTNLNGKMFAYNANKQAYIKNASAGTFAQLVQAAEKCPVSAIHPGTPLNPKEKDLPKWIERGKPFN
ncbi:MAG: ferredoxin, partial [Gemmatimonadaceae bacterium]